MRKEVFFAIIAGGALGLLIAFGVWKFNSSLHIKDTITPISSSTTVTETLTPTPTAATNTNTDLRIVVTSPKDKAVLIDTPINVIGATKQNSWVIVSGIDGDDIVNASETGSFSSSVDLEPGVNQIELTAYDANANSTTSELLAVYSSQFSQTGGVAEAFIGTVTDLANSIIQIKNSNGDIEQIKPLDSAAFVDLRNNNVKTIKQSDIAIGDFLVAMGIKDGNNILTSSRILVTDPLVKTTRKAFYGLVTDDSGINKFVAKDMKTGEVVTVTPAKGVTVAGAETSFGKITNNEKVIAVGEFKDGTLTARTIEVLK